MLMRMVKMTAQKKFSRSKVHDFFEKLGLRRRSRKSDFTSRFYDEVKQAGGDPDLLEEDGDGFGANAQNIFFITEEIAKKTLSTDYDRILKHICDFHEFSGIPVPLERVADMGGGTGIQAMWLAKEYPNAKVTVYDHGEKQLHLGAKWAAENNIRNIDYVHLSYAQISTNIKSHDCDLVFLIHGLNFSIDISEESNTFLYRKAESIIPNEDIVSAARGMANLLKPCGVGIFSNNWREYGLIHLFAALRQVGLGVDWQLTTLQGKFTGDSFYPEKNYIFVRPDIPEISRSAWENARAFMALGYYVEKSNRMGWAIMESFSGLFALGKELMNVDGRYLSGGIHRLRLLEHSGLIFMESTTTKGMRSSDINSAAKAIEFACEIHRMMQNWKECGVIVENYRIDRNFMHLLEFYKLDIPFPF